MGGHSRFFHPNFFYRYIFGSYATIHLWGFMADQSYGIDRAKNPDILWPWWHEIMRKKEKGEIPMDMPGYMLVKYRNEAEEKWTEQRGEEFAAYMNALEDEE
eukprot:TRINITY_DN4407_c0_g1_i1.p2 TRINITY_DN4407_c0_g1~~TRINITY_DN4407_c0_g1_i1.p2  ORF type:complete len:102 (-),score=20.56 TRINITY_DN4407_c0_g1_i1:84-389(-)